MMSISGELGRREVKATHFRPGHPPRPCPLLPRLGHHDRRLQGSLSMQHLRRECTIKLTGKEDMVAGLRARDELFHSVDLFTHKSVAIPSAREDEH